MVTIDNSNPVITSDKDTYSSKIAKQDESSETNFGFNEIKSRILVHNIQPIKGSLHISTGDFSGFRVPFTFHFCGDIKNVSIKRETHYEYLFKKETKTIELYDKESPVNIAYELDLGIGDNRIPIIVTDNRGNTTEYHYPIKMVYRESSTPEINIENNIDIYN